MSIRHLIIGLSMVSFIPPVGANNARLEREELEPLRTVCVYRLYSRTETVEIPAGQRCARDHEIDLFSAADEANEDAKRSSRDRVGSAILSGELDNGATRSCAYRIDGRSVYRIVPRGAVCPGTYNP